MLKQEFLIGKLRKKTKLVSKDGERHLYITLEVARRYKNAYGTYDTDFVICKIFEGFPKSFTKYYRKGDILAVRCHIRTSIIGQNVKTFELIAEKITVMS